MFPSASITGVPVIVLPISDFHKYFPSESNAINVESAPTYNVPSLPIRMPEVMFKFEINVSAPLSKISYLYRLPCLSIEYNKPFSLSIARYLTSALILDFHSWFPAESIAINSSDVKA